MSTDAGSTDTGSTGTSRQDLLRRARHRLRSRLSEYPALYLPLARRRYPGPSPEVVGPQTELVVDGYTRCASTFAVYALQISQDRPVRLAHHLHAPAQIIKAVRCGIPALVLIREPRAAVLSQLLREPGIALPDALRSYARFYECLMPHRARVVVGEFEEVTRDFGSVVRRLNARFDTSFRAPTESDLQECLGLIRHRGRLSPTQLGFESGLATLDELRRELQDPARTRMLVDQEEAWIPSFERKRSTSELRELWLRSDLAEHRNRAEWAYRAFVTGERAPR